MRTPAKTALASYFINSIALPTVGHANTNTAPRHHNVLNGTRSLVGSNVDRIAPNTVHKIDWASLLTKTNMWRESKKAGDRVERLAEVFRCVAPSPTVRIECEIALHEMDTQGQDGDNGCGRGLVGEEQAADVVVGAAEKFVLAWEVSDNATSRKAPVMGESTLTPPPPRRSAILQKIMANVSAKTLLVFPGCRCLQRRLHRRDCR